ncbi:PIN/TRAM domain-containing protein [Candidatus Chloroploca asiatica]|uniref:Twitching motility protein PilT n=1 Tax=Candidatus Chloroploca asiatica TaxID=1506545 RepID=A0A2H3KXC9_9CHLR|nr:PIN domain-containing protein [Candidatus Chloroploca asiatica]PDW00083.1 twitching motility protein PilT [Candidatus Chloroploca asiatica]
MKVSLNFLVRIVGMLGLGYFGWYVGTSLSSPVPNESEIFATQLLTLAGAGLGLLVTPRLTIDPLQDLLRRLRHVPLPDLLAVGTGVMLGLFIAALLTFPLANLPSPFNQILPVFSAALLAYLGGAVFAARRHDLGELLKEGWRRSIASTALPTTPEPPPQRRLLLDTSAIIDGRIDAVTRTGFLDGTLLVPIFVLAELQQLADSADDLRRSKGRRGLELLNEMQHHAPLPIEVVNVDVEDLQRVDDKLVALARQYNCPIITNDFNLNKVAALQGVKVLSLNVLSEAVRSLVIQDQRLRVLIRNEGNARQQGVGYLDDGTPVIVEDARHLIGQTTEVLVTRLHQTQSGRLVFATVVEETTTS